MITVCYRWGPGLPRMEVWVGRDEEQYNEWLGGEAEDISARRLKPNPTYILSGEDMDQLVISWMTGPSGPPGAMGMMGPKGEKGDPGDAESQRRFEK